MGFHCDVTMAGMFRIADPLDKTGVILVICYGNGADVRDRPVM